MDKLTANELRIGNLVTDEFYDSFKTTIKVESINDKGINLLIEDDGNWSEIAQRWIGVEYTFDKLRPIPLTEEWLVRLGFEKLAGCLYLNTGSIEFYYTNGLRLVGIDIEGQCLSLPHINHVHQLQNLYWCLCGDELTIKSN